MARIPNILTPSEGKVVLKQGRNQIRQAQSERLAIYRIRFLRSFQGKQKATCSATDSKEGPCSNSRNNTGNTDVTVSKVSAANASFPKLSKEHCLKKERLPKTAEDIPKIKVKFTVPFRCHSRQMLCIGGNQYPFGWSFVSIAKLPMIWHPNDIWTTEIELPMGMHLEYKYVILEEQIWTKQEDEESEGVVEVSYRSGNKPGEAPDLQKIRKQMAIVDWQPGPNRILDVPTKAELENLKPGEVVQRKPSKPKPYFTMRKLKHKLNFEENDPFKGTWEEIRVDKTGKPVLHRRDIWSYKASTLNFDDIRRLFHDE